MILIKNLALLQVDHWGGMNHKDLCSYLSTRSVCCSCKDGGEAPSSSRGLLCSHGLGQLWTAPGGQNVLRLVWMCRRKERCAMAPRSPQLVAVSLLPFVW